MMLKSGLVMIAPGLVFGLLGALALGQAIASQQLASAPPIRSCLRASPRCSR
jgi:hypothetical protein